MAELVPNHMVDMGYLFWFDQGYKDTNYFVDPEDCVQVLAGMFMLFKTHFSALTVVGIEIKTIK